MYGSVLISLLCTFQEVIYSFNESSVKSNVTNTLSGGEAEDLVCYA